MQVLSTLGINLTSFIAQLLNFTIVLLVLWKFAFKPIVKMLDDRSKKIDESIKRAKEIDERMSKLEKERNNFISNAKTEASAILLFGRKDAEAQKTILMDQAKAEVEMIVKKGKEQLKAEKIHMLEEAKQEMINLVLEVSKVVLKDSVDEKKSNKLATEVFDKAIEYGKK